MCVSGALFAQPAPAATQSFFFTGGEQTYTVPVGVNAIHVTAIGARGGTGSHGSFVGGPPGFGARVEADLAVTPGQVLFVEVGGTGADGADVASGGGGGFNGGGSSNPGSILDTPGGGGGGATDIRICSILAPSCANAANTLGSRLLVAGGGGGGGSVGQESGDPIGGEGGNGGQNGQVGQDTVGAGGGGGGGGAGTLTAGGAGGAADPSGGGGVVGNPGSFGQGGGAGTGSGNFQPGGGGGGGYFGGGAGGSGRDAGGGGGGGGSSFASAAAKNLIAATDASGVAQMVISTNPNELTLGKLTRNKKKGTAILTVDVSGPGTLAMAGAGLVKQRPLGPPRTAGPLAKAVSAAGKVKLTVKAKGKKKKQLLSTGKVKVKAKITYTPTGAVAIRETRRIKLLKKL